LRHRRDHGERRLMERQHRRRVRHLGRHDASRARPRQLHRADDGGGRFPEDRAGDRRDVHLRDGDESFPLATSLSSGRRPDAFLMANDKGNDGARMAKAIIELESVGKSFRSADGTARPVLEGVDFRLAEGEIVSLLGPSGSGKSTMLRIMAGLIGVDAGDVRYRGQPLYGPARGVSMVFQSFALFPWLTVQGNVELGLEARGVAPAERARSAEAAIRMIGLAGFEGAL